jgi:hypothetical protein
MLDYPDFSDAFIHYVEFKDGTPLTDEQLEDLSQLLTAYRGECLLA